MHKACFVSFTGCPGIAPTSGSGPSPLGDTKDVVEGVCKYVYCGEVTFAVSDPWLLQVRQLLLFSQHHCWISYLDTYVNWPTTCDNHHMCVHDCVLTVGDLLSSATSIALLNSTLQAIWCTLASLHGGRGTSINQYLRSGLIVRYSCSPLMSDFLYDI